MESFDEVEHGRHDLRDGFDVILDLDTIAGEMDNHRGRSFTSAVLFNDFGAAAADLSSSNFA